MKTRQEIFDISATHLLSQGVKSVTVNYGRATTACLYRGPGELQCAIGVLIPDTLYQPGMEEQTIQSMFVLFPREMASSGLNVEDEDLLRDLQIIHDECLVAEWKVLLKDLAERYDLKTEVVS